MNAALYILRLVLLRYIDQCPICKSRRFEAIPVKSLDEQANTAINIDFLVELNFPRTMSEDPEIAKIMQRKMDEMLKPKPEPKIEPGIINLNDSNFDQIISARESNSSRFLGRMVWSLQINASNI